MNVQTNGPNKHGLKRYIKESIRKQIREDAGYGCVVCGTLFCDYEHIEPEFHDAEEHDPTKMTLLCESCHGKVTGKRKSKRRVWEAKADPYCKKHSVIREEIDPSVMPTIQIGSSHFHDIEIILSLHGKPLMWLEPPTKIGEPFLISAIFYDDNGKYIASLNRNQFTSVLGTHDVWGKGTRIEIRPQKGVVGLTLNIEGDKPINIERISMNYLGQPLIVNQEGELKFGGMTLSGMIASNGHTAITMGSTPSTPFGDSLGQWKILTVAYKIAKYGQQVITIHGIKCGWVLGNCLIDKNYRVVALHQNGVTSTITGEFIGTLVGHSSGQYMLVHTNYEYNHFEPIWVSSMDKATKNIRVDAFVDVTHRVFGTQNFRRTSYTPKSTESTQYPEQQKIAPRLSNYQQTNDQIKIGDRVNIGFQGKIDGVAFEGGETDNFSLVVGERQMIPGFEDGLIGKKAGDKFDIEVAFPNDYAAENLKGKVAIFSTVVNKTERYAENGLG